MNAPKTIWMLESADAYWFERNEPHDLPDGVTVTKMVAAQPEPEQRCYCGDIYQLGVIHRDDGPCHYPSESIK